MFSTSLLSAALLGQVHASPQCPAPNLAPAPAVAVGDPHGFGAHLNATRSRHGLRPLACDPRLCRSAAANSARGFGHFVGGYRRGQCAGMGPLGSMLGMWLMSPAHARIVLDPGAVSYGIGGAGNVWTLNID